MEDFFINLLVHVILRSLWIGAIGLRYVSDEIDYEKLNYGSEFDRYLRKRVGSYDDYIERLEKLCSIIFSYTFLLFLFFLSLVMFTMPLILIFYIIEALWKEPSDTLTMIVEAFISFYLGIGLIVFVDFITLGGIRKSEGKWVFKIYNPIFIFYSYVTLSFLYRPLLYNFIDQKYTKRLFWFSFPYILIIISYPHIFGSQKFEFMPSTYNSLQDGNAIGDYWYEDRYRSYLSTLSEKERKKADMTFEARLQAFEVNSDIQWVFFRFYDEDHEILDSIEGYKPIYKKGLYVFKDENINTDSVRMKLEKEWDEKYQLVHNKYRNFKKQIKLKSAEPSKVEQDSLNSLNEIKNDLIKQKNDTLKSYDIKKRKNNLDLVSSLVEISVDSIEMEKKCYFHYYGQRSIPGIMCLYDLSAFDKGIHTVTLKRIMRWKGKPNDKIYNLPVIKKN